MKLAAFNPAALDPQRVLQVHYALADVRAALGVIERMREDGDFAAVRMQAVDHHTYAIACTMIARLNQRGVSVTPKVEGGAA